MPQLLTIDEVADYLQVHPATVQRWMKEGKLKAVKLGRLTRIHKDALEIFIGQLPAR